MHEMLGCCLAKGLVPAASLTDAIGRVVIAEINYGLLKKDDLETFTQLERSCRWLDRNEAIRAFQHPDKTMACPKWERTIHAQVGVALMWCGIFASNAAQLCDDMVVGFHIIDRRRGRRTQSFIAADSRIFAMIEDGHSLKQFLRPDSKPMIVPPLQCRNLT